MKRVIIVHGWGGHSTEGWLPWLKSELENRNFEVIVPQLPDTDSPRIEKWTQALAAAAGNVDGETYFVGHSLGCQTIARYLEGLSDGQNVGGVVFVAGFFKRLTGIGDDALERETERLWITAPISLNKVRTHIVRSIAIFSDDDPFVPLDNQEDFKNELGSEVIIELGAKHFNEISGCFTIPVALESVLKLAQ